MMDKIKGWFGKANDAAATLLRRSATWQRALGTKTKDAAGDAKDWVGDKLDGDDDDDKDDKAEGGAEG